MIKAEKYKEKIKELNYRFAVCNGEIKQCEDLNCYTCAFYAAPRSCMENMNKWLLEEYKEPILTDEEKRILQNIIDALRPLGKKVKTISKRDFSPSLDEYLHFTYDDDSATTTTFDGNKMFVGMKIQKEYTLEELGLR